MDFGWIPSGGEEEPTSLILAALFLSGALVFGALSLSGHEIDAPASKCVWSGTGVASCFHGNIDKVPCDYPHPSEFSDKDWLRFAARCRR